MNGWGGDAVRPLVFCPLFKTYRVIGKQKQTKKLSFTTSQSQIQISSKSDKMIKFLLTIVITRMLFVKGQIGAVFFTGGRILKYFIIFGRIRIHFSFLFKCLIRIRVSCRPDPDPGFFLRIQVFFFLRLGSESCFLAVRIRIRVTLSWIHNTDDNYYSNSRYIIIISTFSLF